METPQAPRVRKPPDDSRRPSKLPRAPHVRITPEGNAWILPDKEEGFKGLELCFEAFHLEMTSSWAQLESISIRIRSGDHLPNFCHTLKTMASLKDFKLEVGADCQWAVSVSELLSERTSLLNFNLDVRKMGEANAELLVDVLLENQTLQMFNLTVGNETSPLGFLRWGGSVSMRQLCRYLKSPTNVLAHLDIQMSLEDMEVKRLAGVLGGNTRLTYLRFSRRRDLEMTSHGVGDIADALHSNNFLRTLVIRDARIEHEEMEKLVGALVPSSNPKASLSHLDLEGCAVPVRRGLLQLATIVENNTSLVQLCLKNLDLMDLKDRMEMGSEAMFTSVVQYHPLGWQRILISLQSNKTLRYLNLSNNCGISRERMLGTIMDTLLHNRTIRWIDLQATPLSRDGGARLVYAELKKREKDYQLANMAPISPNSARIFLCGNGEAGKTTLCRKWERKKKRGMIAKMFQRRNSLANVRTRGIEVNRLVWGDMIISVWDMAGQEEYHSFHDLVVPNDSTTGSCCMYFIVCNPYNQPLHKIKGEIHYWLKFVSSNTRRSESYRPHVTILMTHFDLWPNDPILTRHLKEIIVELKKIFIDHLAFDDDKEFVAMDNGIGKSSDALDLKLFAENHLMTLSTKVPKVLKASRDLQSTIKKWNAQHPHRSIVDWETFSVICEEVHELKPSVHMDEATLKKKKQYVATSLHEGGHIMYYEDLSTIIMNPRWFCHDIMGNILFKCSNLDPNYSMISNGIISRKHLEEVFLESLDSNMYNRCFDDSLSIMMKLQICYEDVDGDIMIPSLFSTAKANVSYWPSRMVNDGSSYHYIGTSLASQEPTATMLTAGFFPRLQVYLEKFVPGVAKRSYKLSKDTISFTHRDSDVHIEYRNDRIDIMSRSLSAKGYKLHQEIIKSINNLRSSSMVGCSGVEFEESILRPCCVQELCPYEVRWNQVVSSRELKRLVTNSGDLNYQHHWEENEAKGLTQGFDCAESLLSQDDWQDILQSRFQTLEMVDKVVTSKLTKGSSTSEEDDIVSDIDLGGQSFGDPSDTAGLKKYLQNEFHMLHMKLDQNHDEVKGILRGLKKDIMERQEVLYAKVCSNVSALMEFSVQLIQSRVPKYPVFVPDAKKSRIKQMIPGLTPGRLHFYCEHRKGFHLAPQLGLSVSRGTKVARQFGIVLFWGLTITVMVLKIAAHLGAGMGDMVPTPHFEAFMTVMDTPGLLDMAKPTGPMLDFLPDEFQNNSTITKEDKQAAEDWLVEYLKDKCGTGSIIHEKLGLNRVVYVDHRGETSDSKRLVAWICDEHLKGGEMNGTLRSLGNSF